MSGLPEWVADVQRARRDYLAKIRDLSADQGDFRTGAGEWSIAEITEHLVHAEQGGLSLIWTAADGIRRGKPAWDGDPIHRGLTIEEVVAKTWKPKETAPESARPEWGGPLAFWAASLRACAPVLEELGRALEGLDLESVIYPHPISGPLDARQRFEFLRFHLDRHRGQVERILATPKFPRT